MGNYRNIHSKIWKDDWFLELEIPHKLFFIYLFSNESASLAGIYELSIRVMSFESGLTIPEIKEAFAVFEKDDKAYYRDGVVWIRNFRKYHNYTSSKVMTRIEKDLEQLKDCELKRIYCELYGIDMVSIPPITITTTNPIPESNTNRGGEGGDLYDDHEENQLKADVITAICNVVKGENPIAPSDRLEQIAYKIWEQGAIDRVSGFSQWWMINGYYNGRPALTSFIQEWDNYIDGVTLTQGIKDTKKHGAAMQAAQEYAELKARFADGTGNN